MMKIEILSRLDSVVGNLENGSIKDLSSTIKILIADILEAVPSNTRN
jgi:hypothetical protein